MVKLKTELIAVDPQEPDGDVIRYAGKVLETGGLVVVPTDTVYGLVCAPGRRDAVEAIYRAKGRNRDLPLILLLHDMAQVAAFIEDVPEAAVRAMQEFWPGPLTVILRDTSEATAAVRARKGSIGLRLPAHMVPRLVAGAVGGALASTSANRSEQPAAVTAAQVMESLEGLVHIVLDAGTAPLAQESTVVTFAQAPPRILRHGAVSEGRLREALGEIEDR